MKASLFKIFAGTGLLLIIACLNSCQKELSTSNTLTDQVFNLNINFKGVVDAQPLVFDTPYQNIFNETYRVTTFKYYIFNISLSNTDSDFVDALGKDDHFLINESVPASTVISFKPTAHKYNHITFMIGVDSSKNFSGAQTGALDPAQGMFWTWNSGYIMAKLEGTSPLSNEPNNRIQFHIGGYKDPYNVIKKIVLDFPFEQIINFLPGSTGTINISADVNAWFNNPNDIHIATTAVCMTPGDLSEKIAENYAKMFKVTGVQSN